MPEIYRKPIVYIVHSPLQYTSTVHLAKEYAHLKKLERLLRFAKKNGLKVFWETNAHTDNEKIEELVRKTELPKEDIISVPFSISRRYYPKGKFEPSRIIVAGHYKERCSIHSAEMARQEFQNADLVILRGDFNLSFIYPFIFSGTRMRSFDADKQHTRVTRALIKAKVRPLSRKLLA